MVNPRFVIKAVISGQRLNINVPLTVSGAVNYIGVEAKCTSEWDGCTIVCYILQPSTGYYAQLGLIYDQERDLYYFPNAERLVLSAGQWNIWFVGIIAQSGQEKYRVTTEIRVFTVYTNEFENRLPAGNITLDEQAIAKATDAQNKANLILDLYNQGKLAGPKGDPGDPAEIGFVQASVDNTTENPACTVTVTENPANTYNMQFDFKGIKGAKGDKGDKGDTGETGPQGAPGRDGTNGRDGQTIDDYVVVQENEPSSPTTKMWLKPSPSGNAIELATMEELLCAFPVGVSSGSIASFPDGANNLPIKKLEVQIAPVQAGSGNPSPSNVRTISGWTAVRIYREDAYDPSASPIAEISFPTPPNTIYGGTLNPVTGKLIDKMIAFEYDGSEDEDWRIAEGTHNYFMIPIFGIENTDADPAKLCNEFQWASAIGANDTNIGVRIINNNRLRLRYELNNSLTVNDLRNYLAAHPLQIVVSRTSIAQYQLTPIEVKTVLGQNNIWVDCGGVMVEYRADPTLYIQNLTGATDAMIADSLIASGKYFIISNTLYLSTTIIPAGDAIIPGTNCTKTDLATALNALNT